MVTAFKLFLLFTSFALHRSVFLLFAKPTKSFALVHAQNHSGTYTASYDSHVRFKSGMRLFSATSLCVVVTASVIVYSIMQLTFPAANIQPVFASEQTITVTNNNDSGAGSLREAVEQALNDYIADPELVTTIDLSATAGQNIALASRIDVNAPVVMTQTGSPTVIVGTNMGGNEGTGDGCVYFRVAGSTVENLNFEDCEFGVVLTAQTTVRNNTFGRNVTGVFLEHNADNSTITGNNFEADEDSENFISTDLEDASTLEGVNISNNTFGENSTDEVGTALNIRTADDITIVNNTITKADRCIAFENVANTTVASNTLTNCSGSGIALTGDDNSNIIGGGDGLGNFFSDSPDDGAGNGGVGLSLSSQSDNNTISWNVFGHDASGSWTDSIGYGITVDGTGNTVERNVVGNSDASGIGVSGSGHAFSNNTIGASRDQSVAMPNQSSAYLMNGVSDTTITGDVVANSATGIELNEDSQITISGVTVAKNGQGISLNGVQDTSITDSWVGTNSSSDSGYGNSCDGIQVFSGVDYPDTPTQNISVLRNTFGDSGSGCYGIDVEDGSAGISISQNNWLDISASAIRIASNAIDTPTITGATANFINGTGGIQGGTVEVYVDGSYAGVDNNVTADGVWEVSDFSTNGIQFAFGDIQATSTVHALNFDSSGNTSELSEADSFEQDESQDEGDGDQDNTPAPTDKEEEQQTKRQVLDLAFGENNSRVRVNGERIVSGVHYVEPGQVQVRANGMDQSVQARLFLYKNDSLQQSSKWKEDAVQLKFEGKKKNTYDLKGKARLKENQNATNAEELATVAVTHKAPELQTVKEDTVVTTSVRNLLFDGRDVKGRDVQTTFYALSDNSVLGVCQNPCSLPFEPSSYGEYLAVTQSIGSSTSAGIQTKIVYVPAQLTTVLTTDTNSSTYAYRLVSGSLVTITGIASPGVVKVFVDGVEVSSTTTSAISYAIPIELSGIALGNHVLQVRSYDSDGNERTNERKTIDFRKHPTPVQLLLTGAPQGEDVVRNTPVSFTITGGAENRVHVFTGSTLVQSEVLERIDQTNQGQAVVRMSTAELGSHEYTIYAEDNMNVRTGALTVAFDVVAPVAAVEPAEEVVEEPVEQPTEQPVEQPVETDTDQDGVPDTEDSDTDGDNAPDAIEGDGDLDEDGVPNFLDPDSGAVEGTIRTIQPFKPEWVPDGVKLSDPRIHVIEDLLKDVPVNTRIEIDETVWDIPASSIRFEYNTEAQAAIRSSLTSDNTKSLMIVPVVSTIDSTTGEQLEQSEVEPNQTGTVVLQNTKLTGIQPFSFTKALEGDVQKSSIVYSGETVPYALVIVETNSDPIVKVTRADEEGRWTITVPVDAIGEGEHTAYLQTAYQGVDSEKVEIAKFVVVEERRLSNTTWIFIINIVVALVLVLLVVGIQVKKRGGRGQSPQPPATERPSPAPAPAPPNDDTPGGPLSV